MVAGQSPNIPVLKANGGKIQQSLPYGTPYNIKGSTSLGPNEASYIQIKVFRQTELFESSNWFKNPSDESNEFEVNFSNSLTLGRHYRIEIAMYSQVDPNGKMAGNIVESVQHSIKDFIEKNKGISDAKDWAKIEKEIIQDLNIQFVDVFIMPIDTSGNVTINSEIDSQILSNNKVWIMETAFAANTDLAIEEIQKKIESNKEQISGLWDKGKLEEWFDYLRSRPDLEGETLKGIMNFHDDPTSNIDIAEEYRDLIGKIRNEIVGDNSNGTNTNPLAEVNDFPRQLGKLSQAIDVLNSELKALSSAKEEKKKYEAQALSLLPEFRNSLKLLGVAYSTQATEAPTSNKSINVGTTFGLGTVGYLYSSQLDSKPRIEPDLVTYTAVKIFLAPRDKSLSENKHIYPRPFLSRSAILIGLSTSGLLNFRGQDQDNALTVTPLTGISFDLFKQVELDVGLIWFRQQSVSPVSTRRTLKASPVIGMSWDFDVFNFLANQSKNKE